MKKHICLVLVLAFTLLSAACTGSKQAVKEDDTTPSSNKTTTSYEESSKTPTPSHSELYLPNCSQQQMFDYFEEIVRFAPLEENHRLSNGDTITVVAKVTDEFAEYGVTVAQVKQYFNIDFDITICGIDIPNRSTI